MSRLARKDRREKEPDERTRITGYMQEGVRRRLRAIAALRDVNIEDLVGNVLTEWTAKTESELPGFKKAS